MVKGHFMNETKLQGDRWNMSIIFDKDVVNLFRDNYNYNFSKAEEILNDTFRFLNMPAIKFEGEIRWNYDPYDYKLWVFNLNYFDFLFDLVKAYAKSEDYIYIRKGLDLILSWIKNNTNFDRIIWDPFVTAKRIVNWICFVDFLISVNYWETTNDKKNTVDIICDSLMAQAKYLNRNVEYDLGANHVIMEGKGLVFAGLALETEDYFSKGLQILRKEFSEQVLSDGGHYERSISYHIEVLMHYLEASVILIKAGKEVIGKELIQKIEPMFDYLYDVIKPNGLIPLLNDSSEEYPIRASEILCCGAVLYGRSEFKRCCGNKISEYALFLLGSQAFKEYESINSAERNTASDRFFKDTGYYLIKDTLYSGNELYLLFDVGNNGPDYNLGHTHADNLNVLLSIGDDDIFTDPGAYTYKAGEERNYFRSTSSHNTMTIDNTSSSQIWGAFRVAERAYSHVDKYAVGPAIEVISAYHDGYTRVLKKDKILHGRTLIYYKKKWLLIIDNLYGKISNNHNAALNYVLGENVEVRPKSKNELYAILPNNAKVLLWFNNEYIVDNAFVSHFFSRKNLTNKVVIKKDFDKNKVFLTLVIFDERYHNVPIAWSIDKDELFIQFEFETGHEMLSYNLLNHSGEMLTLDGGLLYY
jgi:uncharacterized heparinase superfamily protein